MSTIAIDARIIASGTGRYVERLVHYLEELDHAHDYLILVRKKDLNYYTPTNPRFKIVEADFADYSFGEQIGFNQLLRQLKPDLVHFCMPQQPLIYTKPAVTTVHDLNLLRISANDDMGVVELRVKKLIFRFLLHRVVRRAKHIITPSQFSKDDLVGFSHIDPNKITVTYEGTDVAAKPEPYKDLVGKDFIMYLGRAEPYKNNRGLILAHQILLKRFPDLLLVIASRIDVLRKADQKWVSDNGYKNVMFTDFIPDEQSTWMYANCRAYVFPSFMEGFGLPALEAMGCGAPIVSTNATCSPEIYQDAAHYFDPNNPEDIARATAEVLTDDKLRQKLITNGKRVHSLYSWRRMAEQTLAVYNNALNTKKTD